MSPNTDQNRGGHSPDQSRRTGQDLENYIHKVSRAALGCLERNDQKEARKLAWRVMNQFGLRDIEQVAQGSWKDFSASFGPKTRGPLCTVLTLVAESALDRGFTTEAAQIAATASQCYSKDVAAWKLCCDLALGDRKPPKHQKIVSHSTGVGTQVNLLLEGIDVTERFLKYRYGIDIEREDSVELPGDKGERSLLLSAIRKGVRFGAEVLTLQENPDSNRFQAQSTLTMRRSLGIGERLFSVVGLPNTPVEMMEKDTLAVQASAEAYPYVTRCVGECLKKMAPIYRAIDEKKNGEAAPELAKIFLE